MTTEQAVGRQSEGVERKARGGGGRGVWVSDDDNVTSPCSGKKYKKGFS